MECDVPEIGSEWARRVSMKSPIAKTHVMIKKLQIVIFSPFKCMKMAATIDALIVAFSSNPDKFAMENQLIFCRFMRYTESALR